MNSLDLLKTPNLKTRSYAGFADIYPGPFLHEDGQLDDRVWFKIPISIDRSVVTYLIFPYGADEEEIQEVSVDLSVAGF